MATSTTKPQYVIGIMTCQKLLHKAEDQYQKYLQNLPKYTGINYVKFVGDPTISEEYKYDDKNNLLTLRCEDDYLNLPNKVFCFFKAIGELFPDYTNVIKMDDDVVVNFPKLYELMLLCQDVPYAGRYVYRSETLSPWLLCKSEVVSLYHELGKFPVHLHTQQYCAGCIYFLSRESADTVVKYPQHFIPFPKDNYMDYLKEFNGMKMFFNLPVFEDYNVGMVLTRLNNIAIKEIRDELITAAYWDGI